jgi:hypothetical protein
MNQAQREMEEAVADWLQAYETHERYLSATKKLFTVFARSSHGSHRYLSQAFTDFREALLKEHGFRHLEVGSVFPQRNPNAE